MFMYSLLTELVKKTLIVRVLFRLEFSALQLKIYCVYLKYFGGFNILIKMYFVFINDIHLLISTSKLTLYLQFRSSIMR